MVGGPIAGSATKSTGAAGPGSGAFSRPPRWGESEATTESVLLATDIPALGAGLAGWLSETSRHWDVVLACDDQTIRENLDMSPAVVVVTETTLAASMPDFECGAAVLVLVHECDAEQEANLLRAGARGVLSVGTSRATFLDALHRLRQGGTVASSAAVSILVAARPAEIKLTERQREVVQLLATGLTVSSIAKQLYVTENTVKTHIARLKARTGARSRTELVARLGAAA